MKKWFSTVLLTLAAAASHAAPQPLAPTTAPSASTEEADRLLRESSLLGRLEGVRHRVTDRAADIAFNAMGFMGVPYVRGGNSAEGGFDCSGFVRAMYEQSLGLLLPRRANEQAAATEQIEKSELKPGDLVFFNTMRRAFSHVGIYVGEGKFIHSPKPGAQVRVEDMRASYWHTRFDGARRVLSAQFDSSAKR